MNESNRIEILEMSPTTTNIEASPIDTPDEIDGKRRSVVDYQSKKMTAEGFMDLSLLTANANQLKFIIYYNQHSKTFIVALGLIIISLVLQVFVGLLLIFRVS
jgi:hypothetical protein